MPELQRFDASRALDWERVWQAFDADGALVVMREGASTTEDELGRLAAERGEAPLFDRPVRVTRHGFGPADLDLALNPAEADRGIDVAGFVDRVEVVRESPGGWKSARRLTDQITASWQWCGKLQAARLDLEPDREMTWMTAGQVQPTLCVRY